MHLSDHIEDLAKRLAGNHLKWESFAWFNRPEDDKSWAIINTHNRDSGSLDRSNARIIARALDPFCTGDDSADCRKHDANHWAVGWTAGFEIRVYHTDGSITEAFASYAELALALEEYPVLDESDFSDEQHQEAQLTWANCFRDRERLDYIRDHRSQFEFHDWADLIANVRGHYFSGYASELCD